MKRVRKGFVVLFQKKMGWAHRAWEFPFPSRSHGARDTARMLKRGADCPRLDHRGP